MLNFYWGRKVEIRDDVFKWFKPIPAGVRLVPSDDALPVFIPEGCKIEQAASFVNEGNIFYDTEIWQKLSATNQAALILHEIVYLEDRLTGAIDSRNARYMVGLLFSDQTLTPVTDGLSRETFRCETDSAENSPGSKQTSFDFYVDSYGKRIAQFDAIAGLKMIEKMTIESFFEADSFPQLKHPIISSARSYQISSANRPFFELYISVLKSKSGSIFNDVTVKVRKSPIPETLQEETPMKCFKYTRAGI